MMETLINVPRFMVLEPDGAEAGVIPAVPEVKVGSVGEGGPCFGGEGEVVVAGIPGDGGKDEDGDDFVGFEEGPDEVVEDGRGGHLV